MQACELGACPLHSFEQLYDGLWARRPGGEASSTSAPGATEPRWCTAAELAHLQRRVADLATELEVGFWLHCATGLGVLPPSRVSDSGGPACRRTRT
jgi:hypothetical protein